jgi:hypothetical protein
MSTDRLPWQQRVLERLRLWQRLGVPPWTYALLVARSFQAVVEDLDPDVYSPARGADVLVWWVIRSAARRVGGQSLTFDELGQAFRWAGWVGNDWGHRAGGSARTWFGEYVAAYHECLPTALIHPADAVAQLADRMRSAELVWPDAQARGLRTVLRITECLHPNRPADLGPALRTADTLGLARAVLWDRAHDRLPVLADALADAGCADDDLLAHLRAGGRHAEGCRAWDLFGLTRDEPDLARRRPDVCDPFAFGWVGHWEKPGPSTRTLDLAVAGCPHGWLGEGADAIVRLADPEQGNLFLFGLTGVVDPGRVAGADRQPRQDGESVGREDGGRGAHSQGPHGRGAFGVVEPGRVAAADR